MVDFDFSRDTDDDRVLLIAFNNEKPISASQVASVLRALDSDYRQMTGRELVLARLEMGSIWIWLVDAAVTAATLIKNGAEVAKAATELGSFAKKLKNGLSAKADPIPGYKVTVADGSVDKSVVAMAKVSEKTQSIIRMKKTLKTEIGVETLEIVVTPAQAKEARERVKSKAKLPSTTVEQPETLNYNELAGIMRSLPRASGDVESIIHALVRAHIRFGSTYVLEQVAYTLEHEGRSDIATIIRQLLGRGKGQIHIEV